MYFFYIFWGSWESSFTLSKRLLIQRRYVVVVIVVASVATGQTGEEGKILRYVFLHSLVLAILVGVLVMLQAYVFTWMIPN